MKQNIRKPYQTLETREVCSKYVVIPEKWELPGVLCEKIVLPLPFKCLDDAENMATDMAVAQRDNVTVYKLVAVTKVAIQQPKVTKV